MRTCRRVARLGAAAPAGAAAALLLAVPPAPAAVACSQRARPDPRVPTWRQVNHTRLGAAPARPEQIDRYLRAVDRRSPRVRTLLAGRSTGGRPIRLAVVGTPAHLAPRRLEAAAARARAIRDGRSAPRAFAASSPVFVWLAGSVHGNEPSGGDADMALLYRLAAGRTCTVIRQLRALDVFLLAVQNPDGRAAGTRFSAQGLDLNRDWFAATQPETQAKLAALIRYPPAVFADQHEEAGGGFFFPPNADPVHHEVPRPALRTVDRIVAPRLRRAFRARRFAYTNYSTYDLFFMGYGDTVPTTLFGAAGMTYEAGADLPFAGRVARQLVAAQATLAAAAAARRRLLAGWAAQWRSARAQGRRGMLQPNLVIRPGDVVRFPVPDRRVYGYAIRGDVHGADAEALARRLAAVGVRVYRLGAPLAVPALRTYGAAAAQAATLPAGSFVVPSAQPAKHWVEAMLGEDPWVPFPYFYDVSSWANPLLMGLDGGALAQPVDLPGSAAPVRPGDATPEPAPGAGGAAWAGGSQASLELAFELLRAGDAVTRSAGGGFATTATGSEVAAEAARRHVALVALGTPAGGPALRLPRVALLAGGDELSGAWARRLLERRYGVGTSVGAPAIAAGALTAYDVLVVPDGTVSERELSPLALARLQAWVRGGGTLVGWRGRGVAVARAAGVTAVATTPAPASYQIPGAQLRIALDPRDPVALGESPTGWAFDQGDPILAANGAPAAAAYPADGSFFVSGYTSGADVLRGTAAITDELVGSGRVVLFAFDPAFRDYTEGTERLVGNALLAPAPPPAGAAARAVRPIAPAALAAAAPAHRDAIVRVAPGDEAALVRAARAAGLRGRLRISRELDAVVLRVPNPRGLSPEERPWTLRLPSALAAEGVRPLLASF